MENLKITKLQAVGLFVIITIAAIFLVINFLKGESLFNSKTTYYAAFNSVDGVTASSPVYLKGYKVGTIDNIEYNANSNNFIFELSLKSEYSIPSNSVAEIYSSDIMGSKSIRINIGDSKTLANAEDTLSSAIIPDMVSMLTEKIAPLADQLTSIMQNLDSTLVSVNSILSSEAKDDIHASLKSLNKTLANAQNISSTLSSSSPEFKEIISNFNNLSQELNSSSGYLKNTLKNVDNISTQISKAELEETLNNLNSLLKNMQDPNGSLGKLMATDSLHTSLNKILNDVDTLVQKITEKPKKFIKISVF